MGKYEVVKGFIDKETWEKYRAGQVIEMNDERANAVLQKGMFIKRIDVDEIAPAQEVEEPKKATVKKAVKKEEQIQEES